MTQSDHSIDELETELLQQAAVGEREAVGALLMLHRDRLKRMVIARIDPRVAGRIDSSDIIQEVSAEAATRIHEYVSKPEVSFFHWLRFLTKQKIAETLRRHVHAQARDVRREMSMHQAAEDGSSFALCQMIMGDLTSPSEAIAKVEMLALVEVAIRQLDPTDREILVLRHFEQLTTAEAAVELGITPNTCRQRHLRALKRMRELLQQYNLNWPNQS
jgi:RNA polymerase sigma-70 factor (ECF subfamily)